MAARLASELVAEGVEFAVKNHRWPVGTDYPTDTGLRRRFGSFSEFKRQVIEAYAKDYGMPEWDRRAERLRGPSQHTRNAILETVESAIERTRNLPAHPPMRSSGKRRDAADMHAIISDVHVGEWNDPHLAAGIAGKRGYSFDVFQERADRHEERLLYFRDAYSSRWKLDKLVVWLSGDIVTGEAIFLGQALQIDRILADQVMEAAHRFAVMIRNWASAFPKVEVFCIWGNHGRIGRPGELHPRTNADYIVYRFIQSVLRDVKNVTVFVAEGPTMIVQHGPCNFLAWHGDALKGAGANGNFVTHERRMMQFAAMTNVPIHYSVSGHIHRGASVNNIAGGRIFTNGSYPGANEYSVERLGVANVPCQKIFLYDVEKGWPHSETDLMLADRAKLEPDANGIYTGNYRAEAR